MLAATGSSMPSWQPHIEVWLLVAALVGIGWYVARVIQPKAVAAGEQPLSRRQIGWYIFGVLVFWIATDFPMHDVAEERLYLVHMIQHALLTLVLPPVMLLATPTWLARLIIGEGGFRRFLNYWARPAPALLINAALIGLSHAAWTVNTSIDNGWLHYGAHTLLLFSSFLVWLPVCGPVPELIVTPPVKILMVFMMSVIPTIPSAFLTTAEGILYQGYNREPRLWGLSVVHDQQLAGVVMKVIAGFYLWGIIAAIFFRWSMGNKSSRSKYRGKLVSSSDGVPSDDDLAQLTGTNSADR